MEVEFLDWAGTSEFSYENLVRKKEIADGSCFFHCLADSFYLAYKMGKVDRVKFIREIRHQLALKLESKNSDGVQWYHTLSRGTLQDLSRTLPEFSLESMKSMLDSNQYVDNRFNEFVSNVFNKDIYILDYDTQDVYITGSDDEILYKNRESIVMIWYNKNHYDLIGILQNGTLRTLFKPNHEFILRIKERMRNKRVKKVK